MHNTIGKYVLWKDCLKQYSGVWLLFSNPIYAEHAEFIGGTLVAICDNDNVDKTVISFYRKGIPVLNLKVSGDEEGFSVLL